MTSKLPTPLIAAHVDLRSFPEMPISINRLLNSDSWLIAGGNERACMITLWLKSWHQVPAGSLPSDWHLLAQLSGAYHDWNNPDCQEEIILRGWVKCSDGRLYHPVVCEFAQRLWTTTKEKSEAGKEGANRRWQKRKLDNGTPIATAERPQCKQNITEQNNKKEESICAVAPKKVAKPKTSLPEIFPNDLDRQWALKHWREHGRDDLCEAIEAQMQECRDHHLSRGTMSADWPASWRTWAQRSIRYNRKEGQHGTRKPTATDQHLAGLAQLLDETRSGQRRW